MKRIVFGLFSQIKIIITKKARIITRTVCLIGLSRFLLLLLHSRQICNGSGTWTRASARNKTLIYLDRFLASINLVSRHCASAHHQLCNRGQIRGSDQICTAIAPALNKICTMTAKTRAKPSLHRDSFLAPLARGTKTLPGAVVGLRLLKHTAGPLCVICSTPDK
jgi:hypothetical protein